MKVNQAYRLCIIRLIGLLIYAGATDVYAAESREADNRQVVNSTTGGAHGAIRDPFNPQAYMAELASKLDSPDGKSLLMKGMGAQNARRGAPPSAAKAAPPRPAAHPGTPPAPTGSLVQRPPATTGGVGRDSGPLTRNSMLGSLNPTPPAAPVASSTATAEAPRPNPTPQVSTLTVWNGLSPHNRAAQKVMEELGTSPAARDAAGGTPGQTPGSGTAGSNPRGLGTLDQAILAAKPGLALWTPPATPSAANLVEKMDLDGLSAALDPNAGPGTSQERPPWSLGTDLDKYRAHAVKEGSRDAGESLKKALERAGVTIGDGVNLFILGYGSDRAKPFRLNDGKGLLDEPGKVPQRAGATAVSFADGMYSIADLISLDSLPDPLKDSYKDNNPLVRPLIYTGRTIGGAWKTTEEVGNALTWGYFDNVTGCVGIVIEDILELFKHVGQAATNLVRAPVQLVAGKKEGVERAMDWVLLVPLEFATNSVQMKGISNMDDYKNAFEDKGVIGSVLEFGGSTFLVYRAVDKMIDELKDNGRRRRSRPETPTDEPTVPDLPEVPGTTVNEILFLVDGEWPTTTTPGMIYFEGQWPAVTIIVE
jgi:hypothetical protein